MGLLKPAAVPVPSTALELPEPTKMVVDPARNKFKLLKPKRYHIIEPLLKA